MDDRRKQRWNNYGRSQNKRPPRGNWQPKVPSWEKQFCKMVGSMDWETLLHMKKFIHLYDDVIKWNDSAGEEAFFNAKKRFWAEINGFAYDSSLPDPDLYIDEINWDSKTDQNHLFELEEDECAHKDHEPVVIFGDSLVSSQGFSSTGWGDYEESSNVPIVHYSSNDWGLAGDQSWGNYVSYDQNANAWIGSTFQGYIPCEHRSNSHVGWRYGDNNLSYSRPNYDYKRADFVNLANVYDHRYMSGNNDFGVR